MFAASAVAIACRCCRTSVRSHDFLPVRPCWQCRHLGAGEERLRGDGALRAAAERHSSRRKLLQQRIEQAYAPLEFLIYRLLHTDDQQQMEAYTRDIELILRRSSHLLSEEVTSALYTLLDDSEAGAALLQPHFFDEFAALKRQFYASWYAVRSPATLIRPGRCLVLPASWP